MRFVNALAPHLRQALSTRADLLDADERPVDISAATDVVRHGVIVVDYKGLVVQMNSAAKRLLTIGNGLQLRGHGLQVCTASVDNALQAAISNALVRRENTPRISS